LFQYKERIYGSIPMLPVNIGSKVFTVFKTVGMIYEAMRYVKCVGEVTHIFYPDSPEHLWWSICHTIDYVIPEPDDILLKIAFGSGLSEIFLPKDVVHVVWIPTDSMPNLDDAAYFNL